MLFAFAAVAAVPAAASYELLLVADAGRNSVYRFDPVTGQSLGTFATGRLSGVLSMGVNASRGEAYILESSSRVTVWDYSTGLFRRTLNVSSGPNGHLAVMPDGELLITNGASTVIRYSPEGAVRSLFFETASGAQLRGVAVLGDRIAVIDRTADPNNSRLRTYDLAFSPLATSLMGSIANPGQLTSTGGRGTYVDSTLRYAETWGLNSGGSTIGGSGTTVFQGTFASLSSSVVGHGNMVYVAGRNSGNTAGQIAVWNPSLTGIRSTFGSGQLLDPRAMAIVVAPEPGTLAALGLGLGVLLRRRRA